MKSGGQVATKVEKRAQVALGSGRKPAQKVVLPAPSLSARLKPTQESQWSSAHS